MYFGDETTVWEVDNELNSPIEPPSMAVSLFLGSNANSGGFFKGIIDEVRVYNRALSFEDVEYIHGFEVTRNVYIIRTRHTITAFSTI